jgi:hypothetical protein
MSHGHIDPTLLARFASGEVGPDLAVEIALHVDDCPACAAIATGADPLAAAYASLDDAPLPDGLLDGILAADVGPLPASGGPEPWVAAALVMAAAVAAAIGTHPGDLITHSWMVLKALGAGASALLSVTSVSWPLAAVAAACALALATGTSHIVARRRMAV